MSVDPNSGMAEATRRHERMVREWAERGHGSTACVGHLYPAPDCPAPQVHREVFESLPGYRKPSAVVPKVTAFTETHVVWAVLNGDLARARELIGSMTPGERGDFHEQLSTIVSMLWGEGSA